MLNSQFIEVGIGLVFVFLLMSIMVSGINEVIVSALDHRGRQLKDAIATALKDPTNKDWTNLLYKHPLIDSLKKSEKKLPAYISSAMFAKTLVDVMCQQTIKKTDDPAAPASTETLSPMQVFAAGVAEMAPSECKTLFQSFINDASGDYEKLKANIEGWYNTYMDRVSGWYKRKTKRKLFVIGFVFAILMNVDTVNVSKSLWENTVLREAVVNAAEGYSSDKDPLHTRRDTTFSMEVEKIKAGYSKLHMLALPIGWPVSPDEHKMLEPLSPPNIHYYTAVLGIFWGRVGLTSLIGWIFTGIAVSFGAPIWFDLLNKLINLRLSVKKGEG